MPNNMTGGWNIDMKSPYNISSDLMYFFNEAINSKLGSNYEIILYLGSQVVSGVNYKLLCR